MVGYTKAINLDPNNAVFYSNRAFAHIKLENFGSAITDATKSLELDPSYVKAYYRRGDAQFALGHIKESLGDFKKVLRGFRMLRLWRLGVSRVYVLLLMPKWLPAETEHF